MGQNTRFAPLYYSNIYHFTRPSAKFINRIKYEVKLAQVFQENANFGSLYHHLHNKSKYHEQYC